LNLSPSNQANNISSAGNPARNTGLRSLNLSPSNQANNISSAGNTVSRTDNSSQSNMRPLFRTSGATEKEKESQRISPVNKLLRKQLNIKMAELERSTSEIDAYNSAALVSIRNQLNANYYEPVRSSSLRSLLGSGSNQANNISSVDNPVSRTDNSSQSNQRPLFRTSGTSEKEKERQRILADNERLREQLNRKMSEFNRSASEVDAYNSAALESIRKKLNTNYNDLYGRN
jgi:hypothetical protein